MNVRGNNIELNSKEMQEFLYKLNHPSYETLEAQQQFLNSEIKIDIEKLNEKIKNRHSNK